MRSEVRVGPMWALPTFLLLLCREGFELLVPCFWGAGVQSFARGSVCISDGTATGGVVGVALLVGSADTTVLVFRVVVLYCVALPDAFLPWGVSPEGILHLRVIPLSTFAFIQTKSFSDDWG